MTWDLQQFDLIARCTANQLVIIIIIDNIYNNKHNVRNKGLLYNTLSNRCLERTLDGTAELEHLPSPGSS